MCIRDRWQRACRIWFALIGNSQWVVEGKHFYKATQNGTQMNALQTSKGSGFWFHNIKTHWGHNGKAMQNIEPKSKHGIKTLWIEPNINNCN